MTTDNTRELARLMMKPSSISPASLVQGVVAELEPPDRLALYLSGDAQYPVGGVRYLSSYNPVEGDVIWLLKNGPDLLALGTLRGADPVRPWNLPWGRIAVTTSTGANFATTAPAVLSLVDVPVILGRLYTMRWQCRWRSDVDNFLALWQLERSPNNAGYAGMRDVPQTAALGTGTNMSESMEWSQEFTPAVSGLDSFRVIGQRLTSTGTCSMNLAHITIFDQGPMTLT